MIGDRESCATRRGPHGHPLTRRRRVPGPQHGAGAGRRRPLSITCHGPPIQGPLRPGQGWRPRRLRRWCLGRDRARDRVPAWDRQARGCGCLLGPPILRLQFRLVLRRCLSTSFSSSGTVRTAQFPVAPHAARALIATPHRHLSSAGDFVRACLPQTAGLGKLDQAAATRFLRAAVARKPSHSHTNGGGNELAQVTVAWLNVELDGRAPPTGVGVLRAERLTSRLLGSCRSSRTD